MLHALALLLPALGYLLIYLGDPGRQTQAPPGRVRGVLRLGGWTLCVLGVAVAVEAAGWGLGPVLALTAVMATGSVAAVVGPLLQAPAGRPDGERER